MVILSCVCVILLFTSIFFCILYLRSRSTIPLYTLQDNLLNTVYMLALANYILKVHPYLTVLDERNDLSDAEKHKRLMQHIGLVAKEVTQSLYPKPNYPKLLSELVFASLLSMYNNMVAKMNLIQDEKLLQ